MTQLGLGISSPPPTGAATTCEGDSSKDSISGRRINVRGKIKTPIGRNPSKLKLSYKKDETAFKSLILKATWPTQLRFSQPLATLHQGEGRISPIFVNRPRLLKDRVSWRSALNLETLGKEKHKLSFERSKLELTGNMSSWDREELDETLNDVLDLVQTEEEDWDESIDDAIASVRQAEERGIVLPSIDVQDPDQVRQVMLDRDDRIPPSRPLPPVSDCPDYVPAANVQPPSRFVPRFRPLEQAHRSIRTAGFLWMMGEQFLHQGHLEVNDATIVRMYRWVPSLGTIHDPIPILIVAFHTLSTFRTAEAIFRGWADRAGRLDVTGSAISTPRGPVLTPWVNNAYWTRGAWELCTMVLCRFLRQPTLDEQSRFLETVEDIRDFAGIHAWTVEYMVSVFYYAESNMQLWSVIFHGHRQS